MKVTYEYHHKDLARLIEADLVEQGFSSFEEDQDPVFRFVERDGEMMVTVTFDQDACDCDGCDEDDEPEIHAYEIPLDSEEKGVDAAFAKILEKVKSDIARRKANRLEEHGKGKRH